jgi:hypothetical protein
MYHDAGQQNIKFIDNVLDHNYFYYNNNNTSHKTATRFDPIGLSLFVLIYY